MDGVPGTRGNLSLGRGRNFKLLRESGQFAGLENQGWWKSPGGAGDLGEGKRLQEVTSRLTQAALGGNWNKNEQFAYGTSPKNGIKGRCGLPGAW